MPLVFSCIFLAIPMGDGRWAMGDGQTTRGNWRVAIRDCSVCEDARMTGSRVFYAGQSVEDYCRACKTDRMHTIVAVDAAGSPLRVVCGFCDSEHQYRGGPRIDVADATGPTAAPAHQRATVAAERQPLPIVAERERIGPQMAVPGGSNDLELLLRRIVREEAGVTPVVPAEKWRGGMLVLRPGTPGLQ